MDSVVRGGAGVNYRASARCAVRYHLIPAFRGYLTGFRCAVQYTPSFPETPTLVMLRGGSWYNQPLVCRVSYRDRYHPDFRVDFIGFRPVFTASKLDSLTNNWRAERAI